MKSQINNNKSANKPNVATPFILDKGSFKNTEFAFLFDEVPEDRVINWPMVYILSNDKKKKAYVGQTTNIAVRMSQHHADPEKNIFNDATVIYHDEFNGSVITDYEHRLIMLMAADGKYQLTNKNEGWFDRNYFSKEEYALMFNNLWEYMRKNNLANKSIKEIEESEIFKYSPYKELTVDQERALNEILNVIKFNYSKSKRNQDKTSESPIVVKGMPGTGKTILLIYLLKLLKDNKNYSNLKIKIVQPETSLRATLREVVKTIPGLSAKDVLSPTDLAKSGNGFSKGENDYDIILVDEAHKLKQRQNIVNYSSYDKAIEAFFPDYDKEQRKGITQLDLILKAAKIPIFFYDPLQSIRPSGIYEDNYNKLINSKRTTNLTLESQMRVQGGNDYLRYIQNILNVSHPKKKTFSNYEFILHTDFDEFYSSFDRKLQEHKLTRLLAGYAWHWNKDKNNPDIKLGNRNLFWNTDVPNWVGKGFDNTNIAHEVGCIHKIQGYDLSYAYVILGDDIALNKDGNKLICNKESYYDTNGVNNASQVELDQFIKNIYYVLLTRGIKGTHVYAVNEELKTYLEKFF